MDMKVNTLITAHSGAENTIDNTLESIRVMAASGADIFEADVRLVDGVLVMSHDAPKPGETADSLEECFKIMQQHDGVRAQMDLKMGDMVEKIDALAQKYGLSKRLIYAGGVSETDAAYARANGLTVWYNSDSFPKDSDWVAGVNALGFDTLNLYFGDVSEKLLSENAHYLSVWTVDDEAMLRKLLAAGVKGITTKRVALALQLRNEIQK